MTTPTPRLEAALARFGAQPGVTPDQEAQLRDAVTGDVDRLAEFNRQADAGQLTGFALEAPGGAPNRTGTYDKAAGVVTLPRASFHPTGPVPTTDLDAVLGVQTMSVDFAYKTWQDAAGNTQPVDQDMVDNLQSTLNRSPVLAEQIKEAWTQGHVRHFSLLPHGAAAGGTYDGNEAAVDGTPKGINLPPLGLQTGSSSNLQGAYNARDMTFVLGHEIQHGFNDATSDSRRAIFLQDINRQGLALGSVHDYSDELRAYIRGVREDEAIANIAGWNALLSREREISPNAIGLDLMHQISNGRIEDFVEADPQNWNKAIPKPGYSFNSDGSLAPTPGNIEAAAQYYFDRPSSLYASLGQRGVGLGLSHSDDYTNYYGNWALEQVFKAENRANVLHNGARPVISIDMAGLGLKEDLLERGGLDLGSNKTPRAYLDTSTTPATPGFFHHTQDSSMGHALQHVPITAGPVAPSGDPMVDRWITALQAGDHAGARAAQQAFARSGQGQALWDAALDDARSHDSPNQGHAAESGHRQRDPEPARPVQHHAQDGHAMMR